MKSIIRSVFSLMVMGAMIAPFATLAEAGKCSPCQAAKSIRDAAAQSLRDAQMAALVAGQAFSRQSAADLEKCPCQKTCRDGVEADLGKCGCQRTTRDEIAATIDVDPKKTVAACCAFCAMPGSLGCQGENRDRCNTCQQGRVRMAQAAAAALAAARESELDVIPADASRAPREELADPCNPCGDIVDDSGCCPISQQLQRLGVCCNIVNQRVIALTKDSKKCCKKLSHKIHDVEELVESVIDSSCCSVIEGLIGDPETSFLDIPLCAPISAADALINSTDADVLTWLKTIAELVYRVHSCVCCVT